MIVGHERNTRYLERTLANGMLAHAHLFSGPEAVGKRTLAVAAASALLCSGKRPRMLGGCGFCEDCRLVLAAAHPDLILLSASRPLMPDDGRGIGIKSVRELERLLALRPWRGGRKVVIIDGAEDLSRDAQSALLKTLEEPDERTTWFLVASLPDLLLATIRSRCVPLGFGALDDEALAPLLDGVPPVRRRLIRELAEGRPGLAARLARDKNFFETFREMRDEFALALRSHLGDQFAFSERASREPAALESFLAYLIRHERSLLIADLSSAAVAGRTRFLSSLLEKLALLQGTTVNRRLIADDVFVELATRERQPV